MSVMDIRNFESFEDLAFEVVEKMQCVEDGIDIVAFYDDAREIIRELVLTGACTIGSMELHDPEWSGYDKEFYITVSKCFDDEWTIWCEPAMRENETEYIYGEADICYLLDNCSSRIIPRIKSSVLYETSIVDEDDFDFECDGDCANCDLNDGFDDYEDGLDTLKNIKPKSEFVKQGHKPKTESIKMDDDMKGFSIATSDDYGYSSFSFHSTDENLVKEMLKIYKKF